MGKMMEIRVKHAMGEMSKDLKKYNVKSGVQRNKFIQNVGMKFRDELKRQCLPNKVTGALDNSIICKPRKGGSEWRVFALSRIERLERGTPISKRFGGALGGGVYKKGAGVLRAKLKVYANHPKYARAGGVKNLANILMTQGTKKYYVISKAKTKIPRIIDEEKHKFREQAGVSLKAKYQK